MCRTLLCPPITYGAEDVTAREDISLSGAPVYRVADGPDAGNAGRADSFFIYVILYYFA